MNLKGSADDFSSLTRQSRALTPVCWLVQMTFYLMRRQLDEDEDQDDGLCDGHRAFGLLRGGRTVCRSYVGYFVGPYVGTMSVFVGPYVGTTCMSVLCRDYAGGYVGPQGKPR